jgi:hypothetical protein
MVEVCIPKQTQQVGFGAPGCMMAAGESMGFTKEMLSAAGDEQAHEQEESWGDCHQRTPVEGVVVVPAQSQ